MKLFPKRKLYPDYIYKNTMGLYSKFFMYSPKGQTGHPDMHLECLMSENITMRDNVTDF